MNKQDVVAQLASNTGLPKTKTEEVLEGFFKLVVDKMVAGEKIQLYGFGNFETANRAARKGINPKTKASIQIPARRSVKFKPAKGFKDAVK